jgi:heat shock protein HtpX
VKFSLPSENGGLFGGLFMLRSHGLLTYSRNTQLKIALMLISFVFVGLLIAVAISLTLAIGFAPGTLMTKLDSAWRLFVAEWHRILLGGLMWTVIATALFRRRVQRLLGATEVNRTNETRLYNIVENMAISTGLSVPQINVVETSATNAFITGLSAKHMSLTFTRGALQALSDRQLAAVVAHQFTLVLSGEARKLTLASTLTGISIFAATWLLKPLYTLSFRTLLIVLALPIFPFAMAGAMVTSALAAMLGAVLLKLSVSKLRIYVCDAGALELTKDAEALTAAIQMMSFRPLIEGADIALRPLFFVGTSGRWFDTHPETEARIAAIQTYVPAPTAFAAPLRLAVQQAAPSWRDHFAIPTWVTGTACSVPIGIFAGYCALTSQWSAVDRKAVQALRDDVQIVMEFGMGFADPISAKFLLLQARLYKWGYGLELDMDALEKASPLAGQIAMQPSPDRASSPLQIAKDLTDLATQNYKQQQLPTYTPDKNATPEQLAQDATAFVVQNQAKMKEVEQSIRQGFLSSEPSSAGANGLVALAPVQNQNQTAFMLQSSPQSLDVTSYRKDQAHLVAAALKDKSKLAKALYDAAIACVIKHEDSHISRKLAQDWAGGFAAIAHSETLQKFKRFPLDVEIRGLRAKADDSRLPSELFDINGPGGQELMSRLSDKGLGRTWSSESCVFQTARTSVESWVSVEDITALGVRKQHIDEMNAGPEPSPEDQQIIAADQQNAKALEQMVAFENNIMGKGPDDKLAKAIERLKQAPWNQGHLPLSAVFFPALFLFLQWKLFRGIKWLLRTGARAIAG